MKFIKDSADNAVMPFLDRISHELQTGNRVLWLICGGSSIKSEVFILQTLQQNGFADNLTIMLMDERYGPVGHPDSNWQQLIEAGADLSSPKAIPALTEPLKSLTETAADYAQQVAGAFEASDIVIGLFGLGADGHTAGILPGTPATAETDQLVAGYETPEFKRITMTKAALSRVNVGYVFAFGDAKLSALRRLRQNKEPFTQLPAKLLSELPEVYIYNDQIEGEV